MTTSSMDHHRPSLAALPRVNDRPGERLLLGRLRQRLMSRASGTVLDIACGAGANFLYIPEDCSITAGDIDATALADARATGKALGREIDYRVLDAEQLPFANGSFDTVVSSLTLCSYNNPIQALQQMARVCHPQGRILLLEHGRSSFWPWARWQDLKEAMRGAHRGCHDNREPLRLVEDAGLEVVAASRSWLGVLHSIEARPCGALPRQPEPHP